MRRKTKRNFGYSVVELIVAIGLFSAVAVASVGALLSAVDAYRKTLSTRLIFDNLDAAIESMIRDMRTGSVYHCGIAGIKTDPQNCAIGREYIAFESEDGLASDPADQIVYQFNSGTGRIERSSDGGGTFIPLTEAPPIMQIETLRFYVRGTEINEVVGEEQPSIVVIIKGVAETKEKLRTEFSLQTTISQRAPDVPL